MVDTYDGIIKYEVSTRFPALIKDLGPDAWLWIKAQMHQESEGNPHAVSPCGAKGLMQLMPDLYGAHDPFDPGVNVHIGVVYMAEQYSHFPEIPDPLERLYFALASYNGGRGYINVATKLARQTGVPWQTWTNTAPFLGAGECTVNGKHPDYRQIQGYVRAIINLRAKMG